MIFKLLTSEDESLLVRWNTFFVLDLLLHLHNAVVAFNVKSDCFSCQRLYVDLTATAITTAIHRYQDELSLFTAEILGNPLISN